jgi:protein-S-isoprenylcysteine O-methyltransferase Ste14
MHKPALLIVAAAWAVFAIRWLGGLRGAAHSEHVAASGGNARWTLFMIATGAVLARYGYRLRFAITLCSAVGAALTVAGLGLSIWARNQLGRNWSKDVALVERQELVTTGPYARIRHPVYAGFITMAVGTALVVETVGFFALVAVQSVFLVTKARAEEGLLSREYGTGYEDYRARSRSFLPFI